MGAVMSRVGQGAPELVLASASPRRLEILQAIGIQPTVRAAAVDERPFDGEQPAQLVERLARAKAAAVVDEMAQRCAPVDESESEVGSGSGTGAGSGAETAGGIGPRPYLVLGADTVIDLDGQILGKPTDSAGAERMLKALSGRNHGVVTGMAVVGRLGERRVEASTVERTEVAMRPLSADDIAWYLATGEHEGKAGSYAIQGLGALLVAGIEGSYHNVVGLSVAAVDGMLRRYGLALRELVSP